MKITDLKAFPVHNWVFVKLETDKGIHGIGEASLSGRSRAIVEVLTAHLNARALGVFEPVHDGPERSPPSGNLSRPPLK